MMIKQSKMLRRLRRGAKGDLLQSGNNQATSTLKWKQKRAEQKQRKGLKRTFWTDWFDSDRRICWADRPVRWFPESKKRKPPAIKQEQGRERLVTLCDCSALSSNDSKAEVNSVRPEEGDDKAETGKTRWNKAGKVWKAERSGKSGSGGDDVKWRRPQANGTANTNPTRTWTGILFYFIYFIN